MARDIPLIPKPVLRYPGSKARIAPWVVSHFPRHSAYLEPFFGSGAILFAKHRCDEETVNDLDGDVTTFFRVLRDQPEELAHLVALTPYARLEQKVSAERYGLSDLETARRFLVRVWQTCGAQQRASAGFSADRCGRAGGPKAATWTKLPERILSVADRLRGVQIETLSALELLERYRSPLVFVYADPPYLGKTRPEALYRHEMLGEEGHLELLNALDLHPGPVVLSGYDHALYRDRLKDWRMEAMTAYSYFMSERTEFLWLNPMAAQNTIQQRLF